MELIELARAAIDRREPVEIVKPIRNLNRTVGTMLGHEISKKWGEDGLPEDTIRILFDGSAGQSFGAFVPAGVSLRLLGDANDYLGKGLSGGKIVVRPPLEARAGFVAEDNIIAGNVILYGATARRGLSPREGRRTLLCPQLGGHGRGRGCGRSWVRVHDRWPCRRARTDRPQLRRGDVGWDRLRLRPGRHVPSEPEHRDGRSRGPGGRRPDLVARHRAPAPDRDRITGGRTHAQPLAHRGPPLREGDAPRLHDGCSKRPPWPKVEGRDVEEAIMAASHG